MDEIERMIRLRKPKHRRDFEIAVICALGLESDAVEILFDHYWDDLFDKTPGDRNSYRTGVISGHNVVLAYMPQMGKGPAATVSAHLRSSFPNIRLALIVGVCGGVPAGVHGNLNLGDVVISENIANYDYGQRFPDIFVSKDPAWKPDFEINGFLRKLKGWKGLQDLKQRTHYHHELLQEKNESYRHTGERKDRLFEPSYLHKHHTPRVCGACDTDQTCKEAQNAMCDELGCIPSQCTIRSSQKSTEFSSKIPPSQQPNIHFGVVASGDTVMKSGQDRDITASRHAAIAFEMEGAGVYPNLQCVIVKGVCDYADSHKDKLWQPFAAGMAAACMKSMLEQWVGNSECAAQELVPPEQPRITLPEAVVPPFRQQTIDLTQDTLSEKLPHSGCYVHTPKDYQSLRYQTSGNPKVGQGGQNESISNVEDDPQPQDSNQLLEELNRVDLCFNETCSTLRECKKCLPRDTDVRRILKTLQAKLRTSVETLVSQAIESPEDAQGMIADRNHRNWQDTNLADSVGRNLGSSSAFTLNIILEIEKKLKIIETSAKNLKNIKENNQENKRRPNQYSNQLKGSLEDLGSLVRVFSSTIPDHEEPKPQNSPVKPVSDTVVQGIESFRIIRQAASSLYDALGKSCSEHPLHNVHLSLHPRLHGTSSQVTFSAVFGGPESPNSQVKPRSIRINIESVIKSMGPSTEIPSLLVPETSVSKHRSTEDGHNKGKKRKRVKFHSVSDSTPSFTGMISLDIPDLFLQQNFCTVVQRQTHEQLSSCNNCIGILGDNILCKHIVYMNLHANEEARSASLSELLSLSKKNFANALGPYDRVRLAKYLATAVLYYHTTPWLSGIWRSEDVHFFGKRGSSLLPRNPKILPYISACVQATNPPGESRPPSSEYDIIIRNPILFGLGVMLLELAYQTPFNDLKRGVDLAPGTQPFANYLAAKRLAEDVNVHISARFKKIVKQCIDCDFGHDSNFQNADLQDAFYSQVIGGLEEIENKLQRLQLDE